MGTANSSSHSQTLLDQTVIVVYIFDIVGNSATYLHGVENPRTGQFLQVINVAFDRQAKILRLCFPKKQSRKRIMDVCRSGTI